MPIRRGRPRRAPLETKLRMRMGKTTAAGSPLAPASPDFSRDTAPLCIAHLRTMFDGMNQCVLVQQGSRPLYANPACARTFGYRTSEDIENLNNISKLWIENSDEIIADTRQRHTGECTRTAVRNDGTTFLVTCIASELMLNSRSAICMLINATGPSRDTENEPQDAKDELYRSELRFRALIDSSPYAISIKDKNHNVRLTNNIYDQWFGKPSEAENPAHSHPKIDYTPAFLAQIQAHETEVLSTGEAMTQERVHQFTDGTTRVMRVTKFPIVDDTGNPDSVATILFDITEEKRIREALMNSERKLSELIEASFAWIWETDENLRYTNVSSTYEGLSGLKVADIVGKTRLEIATERGELDPEFDGCASTHELIELMESRTPINRHRYQVRSDGDSMPIMREVNAIPLYERNKFLGYVGSTKDVSIEVNMERSLQQHSEHLLELVDERTSDLKRARDHLTTAIEGISEGFALFDADDKLTLFNTKYESMFPKLGTTISHGIRFEDVVRSLVDNEQIQLNGQEPETWIAERLDKHRNPGEPVEFQLDDGRWIRIAERRTGDGGIVGVRADITALKEREQEIADKKAVIENTFNAVSSGIAMVDKEMRLTAFNSRFLELHNLSGDDIQAGDPIERFIRICAQNGEYGPEDPETYVQRWLDDMKDAPATTAERTRPDGTILMLNRQPVADGGFITTFTDVTKERKIQAQLVQTSKLATLGEMATGMAHELNQPLNIIRMAAEATREFIEEGIASEKFLKEKLEKIAVQTERASSIIEHMRVFGRTSDAEPDLFDPGRALTSSVELIAEQAKLDNIAIEAAVPEYCRQVRGHRIQLEQVILNILGNARDAILARSVEDGKGGAIKTSIIEMAETIKIEIWNTGEIPENVIERIFEPFFTTKETGKGTGLGLSISFGIIEEMGGSITAANRDGGASFAISLPVAAA